MSGQFALGRTFRTCENFWESTDSSLVLSQKFSQDTKFPPQFLPLRFCESQNLGENSDKSAESANKAQQTIEGIAVEVVGFLGDFGCETGLKSAKHSKSPKSPQDAPKSKLPQDALTKGNDA